MFLDSVELGGIMDAANRDAEGGKSDNPYLIGTDKYLIYNDAYEVRRAHLVRIGK